MRRLVELLQQLRTQLPPPQRWVLLRMPRSRRHGSQSSRRVRRRYLHRKHYLHHICSPIVDHLSLVGLLLQRRVAAAAATLAAAARSV